MAKSIPCILAGRLIAGFAVGLVAVPAQVLIGEMADPGLRGLLVGIPFAAYSMGILFVYILGATFSWETVAFCGTALPLLALLTLSLIPESPAWLVKRRRIDAAKKALLWLRGGDIVQVNTEIALLEARAKADVARISSTASLSQQATSAISKILNPGVLKPLAIINIFNFLQILSGTYVIVFYGVNIISKLGGDSVDKYMAAVVTAAIRFLFCLVCCVLLLKVGRRPLGIISAIGTAVTCLILAGYMLAKKENSTVDAYVIGFCLLMYVAANTIGLMSLPGVMLGELLPLRARGIGGGSTFFIFNLLIFSLTKLFPLITERVGITGVFTIFGASALLESVFVYVALPETKGRSLQQIEDYFQQGNVLWVTRKREPKSNDGLTIVNV
ncbi:facilitated trehalose transporter Tret1-2 homolog [Cephus cinctus]|nr:facilitated trehalose transporter Tret1-2 homolog [Cephus cinctus]